MSSSTVNRKPASSICCLYSGAARAPTVLRCVGTPVDGSRAGARRPLRRSRVAVAASTLSGRGSSKISAIRSTTRRYLVSTRIGRAWRQRCMPATDSPILGGELCTTSRHSTDVKRVDSGIAFPWGVGNRLDMRPLAADRLPGARASSVSLPVGPDGVYRTCDRVIPVRPRASSSSKQKSVRCRSACSTAP